MKLNYLVAILLCVTFYSCDTQKDGLIVKDLNTGKFYLLEHNVGDTYFIKERKILISGKDTSWIFE